MKKTFSILFILYCFISCQTTDVSSNDKAKNLKSQSIDTNKTSIERNTTPLLLEAWKTDTVLKTPESVLYHDGTIYVSNINGKDPLKKDNNGFISKINTNGSINKLKWAQGMHAPKGMGILNNVLYVTDIDQLVTINLASGEIINRYPVDKAEFLNDISIANNTVFFSDMNTGKIHQFKNKKISTFLSNLGYVNGLLAEETMLYALTGNGITSITYDSKSTNILSDTLKAGDGIVRLKDGTLVASRWQGEIYHFADIPTLLLDTKKENKQTADIGYLEKENLILVPTFFDHRVVAYKLIYK